MRFRLIDGALHFDNRQRGTTRHVVRHKLRPGLFIGCAFLDGAPALRTAALAVHRQGERLGPIQFGPPGVAHGDRTGEATGVVVLVFGDGDRLTAVELRAGYP